MMVVSLYYAWRHNCLFVINITFHNHFCVCVEIILSMLHEAAVPYISPPLSKSRPTLRAWKTPWRKWPYLLVSIRLKYKHRTTFCAKRRLPKCLQSRVLTNSARRPESHIFRDFAKGGPRETGPRSRPTLGAWKTPWRKWPYLLISMRLKYRHRKIFCAKRRLPKGQQSRVLTNLARKPKSRIFWDFAKGGSRETGNWPKK